MKTKLFNLLSILLLISIVFSSCKKEILDEKKTTDKTITNTIAENQNISNQSKLSQVDVTNLSYIGNYQWSGYWKGVELIFSGISDIQLMDGLRHSFSLVSAKSGDLDESTSFLGGNCWKIGKHVSSLAPVTMPKIDWIEKTTGKVVNASDLDNWYIITSANFTRSVGSYTATVMDLGAWKEISFSIMVIQVDNHLEMCSYTPGGNTAPPELFY